MSGIARRAFVRGVSRAVASAALLPSAAAIAACGDGSADESAGDGDVPGPDVQVIQRFPQVLVPGPVRLPVSLARASGLLGLDAGLPDRLDARIVDAIDGATVAEGLVATRHGDALAAPYWPFRTVIPKVGTYTLVVDGASADGASFSVLAREAVAVVGPGDVLAPFDTPTFTDARGVDPICTHRPAPCPFHEVTLREALASGRPVAYFVGTPAHCATGTCAPGLDALIEVAARVGDAVVVVHAEVYADEAATIVAPAVEAAGLTYEPALWVTDARGRVVTRLDAVFDAAEIADALASAGVS